MPATLEAKFAGSAEWKAVFDAEVAKKGMLLRGATVADLTAGAACVVTIWVGARSAEVPARIGAVIPGVGVAVLFDAVPEELRALTEAGPDGPPASLWERLKALSVTEKMQLAVAGSREERAALFRDANKTVHVFVLKNPRLGLDEVQAAAKLPNLSPDALKQIAEHREWAVNPGVVTALVRNPKTPMPIALKLIDRVPVSELRLIAKGGAREQIVHAARKKLSA